MFDLISDKELRELAAVDSSVCISIYLPTHASGSESATDPIRLKNLLSQAKHQLGLQIRSSEAAELLDPVEAMVDDTEFWAHVDAGLAVFVTSDEVRWFRLPEPVEEAVLVSGRFRIAPLLRFVSTDDGFYVLALSENNVRLLQATRYRIADMALGEIPANMATTLRFDDRESQLQSHGSAGGRTGQVSATFHGQGVAHDFDEVDRTRFLQAVDRGLAQHIGASSDPVVLAGVTEIVSQFRNLSSNRAIAESFIGGNPEQLSPQRLHDQAVPLLTSHFKARQTSALELFGHPTTPTVDSVPDAVDAAESGRVATLFMASARPVWGSINLESREVHEHLEPQPGDDDLVDLAARKTLEHGGEVFFLDESEMPTDRPLAAVLRY